MANTRVNLGKINQIELQNMRHIISSHQLMATKYDEYSKQCQDPQLKQLFKQSGQSAQTTATDLMNSMK